MASYKDLIKELTELKSKDKSSNVNINPENAARMRMQNQFQSGLDIARYTAAIMRKDMEEYERLEIGNDVQNYSGSDSELRQTYYIMNTDSSSCGSSSSYSVQSGDSDESMSK